MHALSPTIPFPSPLHPHHHFSFQSLNCSDILDKSLKKYRYYINVDLWFHLRMIRTTFLYILLSSILYHVCDMDRTNQKTSFHVLRKHGQYSSFVFFICKCFIKKKVCYAGVHTNLHKWSENHEYWTVHKTIIRRNGDFNLTAWLCA